MVLLAVATIVILAIAHREDQRELDGVRGSNSRVRLLAAEEGGADRVAISRS